MWTVENRPSYNRDKRRYPSDVTDEEWAYIAPLIPPAKRGGRRRAVDVRDVLNGVMYLLATGCQWRYLPKDVPPRSTVFGYFCLWTQAGVLEKIHQVLYEQCREKEARAPTPSACIIDSQRVKSAEKGGDHIDPHGCDGGKLIKGKKRHILVDTLGLLLHALVHSASVQDRDGGLLVFASLGKQWPLLTTVCADGAYAGPIFRDGLAAMLPQLESEIVTRSDDAKGFVVLPKRWIVERTLAWLNRCRRLATDWENLTANALAFLKLASIRLMLRKLCNPS